MSDTQKNVPAEAVSGAASQAGAARKPYRKPARRSEEIFETSALACGKLNPTQAQCQHNRKTS
jgi:hypothetical protein